MAIANTFSISPTSVITGGAGGPLADLNKNPYSYNMLTYPEKFPGKNIKGKSGHYIVFYINTPARSAWDEKISPFVNPAADLSKVDPVTNRNQSQTLFGDNRTAPDPSSFSRTDFSTSAIQAVSSIFLGQKTKRTSAAISLYMPDTVIFDQGIKYDTVSLTNALGDIGTALYGVSSLLEGGWSSFAGSMGSLAASALGQIKTGMNIPDLKDIILQKGIGIADNPQNLVLFREIAFRKFQFEFILTPENEKESNTINQILYLFRYHSAPEVKSGSAGRFFVPPSDFDIEFIHNNDINKNLPKISTCVLENVTIDYAAGGKWTTYYDGNSTQTKLTLQFMETQIPTKDSIKIGF